MTFANLRIPLSAGECYTFCAWSFGKLHILRMMSEQEQLAAMQAQPGFAHVGTDLKMSQSFLHLPRLDVAVLCC